MSLQPQFLPKGLVIEPIMMVTMKSRLHPQFACQNIQRRETIGMARGSLVCDQNVSPLGLQFQPLCIKNGRAVGQKLTLRLHFGHLSPAHGALPGCSLNPAGH